VGAGRGIPSGEHPVLLPARLTGRPHEAVDTKQQNDAALSLLRLGRLNRWQLDRRLSAG
jgi:hypothetical protein